jgi:hypothetical protein
MSFLQQLEDLKILANEDDELINISKIKLLQILGLEDDYKSF